MITYRTVTTTEGLRCRHGLYNNYNYGGCQLHPNQASGRREYDEHWTVICFYWCC